MGKKRSTSSSTHRKSKVTKATASKAIVVDRTAFQNALKAEKMIYDLIIKSEEQDQLPKIFKTIQSNLKLKDFSGRPIKNIPKEEIETLCSLIQKDHTSISAQSINQLLQPYIKTTLTIAGGLSLFQTLFHYFEDNVMYWGGVAIVATLGMLNQPLSKEAAIAATNQQQLKETSDELLKLGMFNQLSSEQAEETATNQQALNLTSNELLKL